MEEDSNKINNEEDNYKIFRAIENFIHSNFDENYLKIEGITQEAIEDFKNRLLNLEKEAENVKSIPIPKEFVYDDYLSLLYAKLNLKNDYDVIRLSKVTAFLRSQIIIQFINDFINKEHISCFFRNKTKKEDKFIDENILKFLYILTQGIEVKSLIDILYPYLYSDEEIENLDENIKKCHENNESYEVFSQILINFFGDLDTRLNDEYKNRRDYENVVKEKIQIGKLDFKYDYDDNIQEEIEEARTRIKSVIYIVDNYKQEYDSWISSNDLIMKQMMSLCNLKFYYFFYYYKYIDGFWLYNFFKAINATMAYDMILIKYIRKTASKLRIASYLNEEYQKHIKNYNLKPHDFNFGEDEPEEVEEEETAVEEQSVIKDNYEEADIDDERTHLTSLPHFKEDKLLKLLDRFKQNDLNYIHKFTKKENWLFVFGLKGDTPPEGFEKVQWRGKNKKKPPTISPKKFINLLEILGYNLDELYKDVELLNRCFIAKEKDKKILQKDFDYKGGKYGHVADYQKLKDIVSEIGLCP